MAQLPQERRVQSGGVGLLLCEFRRRKREIIEQVAGCHVLDTEDDFGNGGRSKKRRKK